jgi:hypothetical protein
MKHKKNSFCRYCFGTKLSPFLSLGLHPPSDSFLKEEQIPSEQRFPLEVYFCTDCSLVQLLDVVSAEDIFDEYVYLASSSKALKNHYGVLAGYISERLDLKSGDVVVDIGCNDGILLSGYSLPGLLKVGVEPSKVAEHAVRAGFSVVKEFFGASAVDRILSDHGKARVVTATNVFPHVDDIATFTENIPRLLAEDGIFVIEASYLIDLIDQTLFDTIYHEHLCYLSLTSVVPFLAKFGLEVFDVERIPFGASGPAVRIWSQKKGGPHLLAASVGALLQEEKEWGVHRLERYLGYAKQVEELKESLLHMLKDLRKKGARIGGYGAPAKGNTLLNYVGLGVEVIECIAENNPLKQGMVTPGTHIPVVSDQEFLEKKPDYALLLSWNYLDFFLQNSAYIKTGGRFIVPIPTPRIVP